MKTAARGTPKRSRTVRYERLWCGTAEPISLDDVGWQAIKNPAEGGVFFLDFPLYRANRVRREKVVVHSGN